MAGSNLSSIKDGVGASMARMTMQQRLTLAGGFVATLVLLFVASRLGGNPPMGLLYGGLDPEKAQEVTSELTTMGVPYELGGDGTSIFVPQDRVNQVRLDIAGSGISSGPEGWSLLDEQGFTTSEFDQRTGYQRALQGELAMTIGEMSSVESARVSIVMPESDLFSDDEVFAKANVSVELAGAGKLTDSEVQVILNMVAGSVEGLSPENVSVSDTNGTLYAAPGMGDTGTGGGTAFESARAYENELEASIRSMLEGVVGPGNARVSVTADLDFSQSVSEIREVTPVLDANGEQVIGDETVRDEDYIAPDGQLDTGLLGTEDNLIDPVAVAETNELFYRLRESDRGYLFDETVTTRTEAPGAPTSLSVAVVLDATVLEEVGLDDAASITSFEELVGAAVGVKAERGDVISVTALPFDTATAEAEALAIEEAAAAESQSGLIDMIRTGATGLIAFVIVVFSVLMLRKGRKNEVIESIDLDGVDLRAIPAGERAAAELEAVKEQRAARESDIYELIENQPEEVADLLRLWLTERESA